jgi:hypothetical protein
VYYKESTPFCRKTIINQCRVKQITENNVELNLIRNYLYLVFGSIKIFSDLKGRNWFTIGALVSENKMET